MKSNILYSTLFIFGGMGTLLRFFCYQLFEKMGQVFWFPTLFVNILGSIVFFLLIKETRYFSADWQIILRTGFLGAFTTFSTFAYEIVVLIGRGEIKQALIVMLLNVFFGVIVGIGIIG